MTQPHLGPCELLFSQRQVAEYKYRLLRRSSGPVKGQKQAICFPARSKIETMSSKSDDQHVPSVTLPQGTLRGIVRADGFPQSVECFLGFPYAQPPVGNLRFRPPVPVEASSEIFDASEYGKAAPGNPLIPPRIPLKYSEDCLTVNVFRPRLTSGSPSLLPVAVYFHGGAFNRGNSSMQDTASMVAWSEEPFVAVSFNYRVGALGFLPSTQSAQEGILNLGFQDQRLLLRWVQQNIHAFGGDKNNVTLMGLSAGAIAVSTILEGIKPTFTNVKGDRTSHSPLQRYKPWPIPPSHNSVWVGNYKRLPSLQRRHH